jgi:phosphoribosylanthranilate isomerase
MKQRVGIKICGISEAETLKTALSHGARFVGFVHYPPSPRHVSFDVLSGLAKLVPAEIGRVGVLVNPDQALLQACRQADVFSHLQIHQVPNPARLAWIKEQTNLPLWQAVGVSTQADIAELSCYAAVAELLLFDAKPNPQASHPTGEIGGNESSISTPLPGGNASAISTPLPGGNGVRFDWRILQHLRSPLPWMLSGGLDEHNIRQAVEITGARLLDVSSGVEEAPGVKSALKIAAFLKAAHQL